MVTKLRALGFPIQLCHDTLSFLRVRWANNRFTDQKQQYVVGFPWFPNDGGYTGELSKGTDHVCWQPDSDFLAFPLTLVANTGTQVFRTSANFTYDIPTSFDP